MSKLGLIARQEYLRNTRRRSFLTVTFGLPALMIALMAASILASSMGGADVESLGYVDRSGVLAGGAENPGFVPFATLEEATTALEAGQVGAVYILATDYGLSGAIELLYRDRPPRSNLQDRFEAFLRAGLVSGLAPEVARRALDGPQHTMVLSADGRHKSETPGPSDLILPFALGLFVSFALMAASGYLAQAITDEKENRTIEVMTTSVSPRELIAGKAVGLAGVALSQVALWAIVIAAGLAVASRFVASLSSLEVPWGLVLVLVAFFVPLFTLSVALVVTIGVVVADPRQGQQWTGLISFFFLLPLFFSPLLGSSPDGPPLVALTLFPTTSLLTIAVRWSATVIPLWQLVGGWVILAACAGAGIWAAPRVFRQGMLRYGRRMTLRSLADALRTRG